MADKYAKTGNWSDPNTWSLTDGGAGGAGAPSASENAFFSNQSGNVVFDASITCLDLDCTKGTGYTGTWSGSGALSISGNYTLSPTMVDNASGARVWNATSGIKTIQQNGITSPHSVQFNGPGATFQLLSNWTLRGASINFNRIAGTFDANGKTVIMTGGGTPSISGSFSGTSAFYNLSRISTAAKTDNWRIDANLTVNGTLTITGNSLVNRILMLSLTLGTPVTITCATAPVLTNVDFQDIASAGAGGTWAGTSIGDCGGNSGITFDAPVTQTATGTASFTWSTHGWTTRVPLPQDDVVINNAFIAGRTITADMPRLGKSIDMSGCTGTPVFTPNVTVAYFGSLAMAAGMTVGGTQTLRPQARSTVTLMSAGVSFPTKFQIMCFGGTFRLLDALVTTVRLDILNGTFDDNGFTVTAPQFTDGNSTAAKVLVGNGTWIVSGSDSAVTAFLFGPTGLTVTPGAAWLIKFTDATATSKTFAGAGKTYKNVWFNNAGSGTFDNTGSNSFNQFKVDAGRSVRFTAGTTTTAADWQFGAGCTIGSITAAGHTLAVSPSAQVVVPSPTVSRSTGSPANKFVAASGTDGANNSGWVFGSIGAAQGQAVGSAAVVGHTASVIADADFEFLVPLKATQFRVPLNHRVPQ